MSEEKWMRIRCSREQGESAARFPHSAINIRYPISFEFISPFAGLQCRCGGDLVVLADEEGRK